MMSMMETTLQNLKICGKTSLNESAVRGGWRLFDQKTSPTPKRKINSSSRGRKQVHLISDLLGSTGYPWSYQQTYYAFFQYALSKASALQEFLHFPLFFRSQHLCFLQKIQNDFEDRAEGWQSTQIGHTLNDTFQLLID